MGVRVDSLVVQIIVDDGREMFMEVEEYDITLKHGYHDAADITVFLLAETADMLRDEKMSFRDAMLCGDARVVGNVDKLDGDAIVDIAAALDERFGEAQSTTES